MVGKAGLADVLERVVGQVGHDDACRPGRHAFAPRGASGGRPCRLRRRARTVSPGWTRAAVRDGAPATSSAASAIRSGMSSGRTANGLDSKRTAVPQASTCPWCISTPSTRSSRSGVSVSEIRLAMRWPGRDARGSRGRCSPPPAPSRRACRPTRWWGCAAFRARRRSPRWPRPTAAGSPPASAASWRKLAESRFSRSTSTRISASEMRGSASSFHAGCGKVPVAVEHPVKAVASRQAEGHRPRLTCCNSDSYWRNALNIRH